MLTVFRSPSAPRGRFVLAIKIESDATRALSSVRMSMPLNPAEGVERSPPRTLL